MEPNPASNIPDIDYTPPQPIEEGGSGGGKKVFIGCSIGCLVLVVVMVIAGIVMFNMGIKTVLNYTSEDPVEFAVPVADQATIDSVNARFDGFLAAMSGGQDADPLVLTGEEINLLFNNNDFFSGFQGFGESVIEEDRFTARISFPTDAFAGLSKKFEGRYINGEATIRFLINQGQLEVYLIDLKGAGKSIPEVYLTQLRSQNLMENQRPDPKIEKLLETLEDLKVEDGKLWIVPKPAADRPKP